MSPEEKRCAEVRLRLALEMHALGVAMMRQNLRRADPAAAPEEIERRLRAWLQTRPGAEFGDADGKPVQFPRRKP
jgi:hypothetical protein